MSLDSRAVTEIWDELKANFCVCASLSCISFYDISISQVMHDIAGALPGAVLYRDHAPFLEGRYQYSIQAFYGQASMEAHH